MCFCIALTYKCVYTYYANIKLGAIRVCYVHSHFPVSYLPGLPAGSDGDDG